MQSVEIQPLNGSDPIEIGIKYEDVIHPPEPRPPITALRGQVYPFFIPRYPEVNAETVVDAVEDPSLEREDALRGSYNQIIYLRIHMSARA